MATPDPIRHAILLMLENRSFDQTLGDLHSAEYGNRATPLELDFSKVPDFPASDRCEAT